MSLDLSSFKESTARLAESRPVENYCMGQTTGNLTIEVVMEAKPSTRRRRSTDGSTTKPPTDSDVLTLDEAAIFFKCDPITVKRRAKILHIPHKRLGSLWRFYRPSLVAWMKDEEDKGA